jgi:hypothetical protein
MIKNSKYGGGMLGIVDLLPGNPYVYILRSRTNALIVDPAESKFISFLNILHISTLI